MNITAIIEQGENGWLVGQLEEFPAVIDQGKTLEELKHNLLQGLEFYLDVQREQTMREYEGRTFQQETLVA